MKPKTERLLDALDRTAWFSTVGQAPPESLRGTVVPVASWAEAVECCSSDEWSNFTLEQQNSLTMHLHTHARDRYRNWNDIVDSVKAVSTPLLERWLAPALAALGSAEAQASVVAAAEWDILGACMELEYADIRAPSFFCGLMPWYISGRFPCGWGERTPAGAIQLYGPVDEGDYDPTEPDWLKLVLANQERLFHPQVKLPSAGKLVVY